MKRFVYEPGDDRAKLAHKEFIGFDGEERDNVIIQVKNESVDLCDAGTVRSYRKERL